MWLTPLSTPMTPAQPASWRASASSASAGSTRAPGAVASTALSSRAMRWLVEYSATEPCGSSTSKPAALSRRPSSTQFSNGHALSAREVPWTNAMAGGGAVAAVGAAPAVAIISGAVCAHCASVSAAFNP